MHDACILTCDARPKPRKDRSKAGKAAPSHPGNMYPAVSIYLACRADEMACLAILAAYMHLSANSCLTLSAQDLPEHGMHGPEGFKSLVCQSG